MKNKLYFFKPTIFKNMAIVIFSSLFLFSCSKTVYGQTDSLLNAFKNQDIKQLEDFLADKGDPNQVDASGLRLIWHAVDNSQKEMVDLLLAAGSDPNTPQGDAEITPLMLASGKKSENDAAITQLLLKAGALSQAKDKKQRTALHIAADSNNVEAAKLLLKAGAEPDARDYRGYTPLHYAAGIDDHKMTELLLNSGATPDIANAFNFQTPLHIAATNANPEIARLLLSVGARNMLNDKFGRTALHYAAADGTLKTLELLVNSSSTANVNAMDSDGETALRKAEKSNQFRDEKIRILFEGGALPNF